MTIIDLENPRTRFRIWAIFTLMTFCMLGVGSIIGYQIGKPYAWRVGYHAGFEEARQQWEDAAPKGGQTK